MLWSPNRLPYHKSLIFQFQQLWRKSKQDIEFENFVITVIPSFAWGGSGSGGGVMCLRIQKKEKRKKKRPRRHLNAWTIFFDMKSIQRQCCLLAWWCLVLLSSTIFQLYRGVQLYWWRKPDDSEKIIDLSQVTDNFIT